ncbi:MAG: TraX family protein [Velocimicrobium sp.]
MIERIKENGLTGFQIKIIALGLMVLDHIYYFFSFTGKVPLIFNQLGRIPAALFLFMVIEGFYHTSNRKKYFLRIYSAGVLMGIVQYAIIMMGLIRGDGFYPQNNIFAAFAIIIVIMQGIEWVKEGKKAKGILTAGFPFLVYSIVTLICPVLPQKVLSLLGIMLMTVLPIPFNAEGGIGFIVIGVVMYLFRKNQKKQIIAFIVATLIFDIGMAFIVGATWITLFTEYFEWMEVFAAIFMCLYNGKRGKSAKKLFYIFYPAHIYLLYILSLVTFYAIY